MREDRFLLGPLVARAFQQYWRFTRGIYLSVEACVIDDAGRTLMVRQDENGGWNLPATTAQNGETLETAVRRGLRDIAGIEVNAKPELRGFYAGIRDRRTGQISPRGERGQTGLYVVRDWRRLSIPNTPATSTPATSFFPLGSLPAGLPPMTAERIRRSHEGRTISQV
ncbi:ADP-ribose pyrophosphatase YjhB, NUDIX family [Hyphomicrobium facile]|uniref:ADP-ribose pyrophosphatase YjhB, NUDIX family n=1 Tax=Hyphomicrobium facile TaxID=51670 RepID=A0A1I7MZW8_9HYPH|nr:ADP-ribose pyrophosphatase YjhB, NUDIX family [Hyphomicrobium facile]